MRAIFDSIFTEDSNCLASTLFINYSPINNVLIKLYMIIAEADADVSFSLSVKLWLTRAIL